MTAETMAHFRGQKVGHIGPISAQKRSSLVFICLVNSIFLILYLVTIGNGI